MRAMSHQFYLELIWQNYLQEHSHWGGQGIPSSPPPPHHTHTHPHTSTSKPKKVQQFQFQTSAILSFMGVQELYGQEISRFLPCMLQSLDNLWQIFIFFNYIRDTDHFTMDLLKRSDS